LIFIDEIFKLFIYTRAGTGTTGLFFYSQDVIPEPFPDRMTNFGGDRPANCWNTVRCWSINQLFLKDAKNLMIISSSHVSSRISTEPKKR
jgi:hypothetical protein